MASASEQCKEAGFNSMADLARKLDIHYNTLRLWHMDRPELFKVVLAGAKQVYINDSEETANEQQSV